jgi:hypothetical protein
MKEQTITQNMSLFHADRARQQRLLASFYAIRQKQLMRDKRRLELRILWLRLRKLPDFLLSLFK